jgi:translation initiation factor IF-2
VDDLQQQLQQQLRASAEAEALAKRQAEAEAERQREAERERAAESETTPALAYTASAGKKIATNSSSSSRAETLKRSADAGAALFARMLAGSRSADKALEAQVRDLVLQMCCECVTNVFLLMRC